jgi:hypothetical protein
MFQEEENNSLALIESVNQEQKIFDDSEKINMFLSCLEIKLSNYFGDDDFLGLKCFGNFIENRTFEMIPFF